MNRDRRVLSVAPARRIEGVDVVLAGQRHLVIGEQTLRLLCESCPARGEQEAGGRCQKRDAAEAALAYLRGLGAQSPLVGQPSRNRVDN